MSGPARVTEVSARVRYSGPITEIANHLESCGVPCDPEVNIADIVVDLTHTKETDEDENPEDVPACRGTCTRHFPVIRWATPAYDGGHFRRCTSARLACEPLSRAARLVVSPS